ncbi:MAG TPA: hypothetical protein VGD61_09920 [Pyrinomonadaceae bacterium]
MERLLPRIWVFVLAFGLGISISAIWRIYTLPAFSIPAAPLIEPLIEAGSEPGVTSGEGPRLREGGHRCGAAADQVYEYDDGGWVVARCREFKSSADATREVGTRLLNATIAQRSVTEAGEEILLTAPDIVRLRKKGSLLCELKASSLSHLNRFEKR